MPEQALLVTLMLYMLLAVLLLGLNIFSVFRWWVKATAIVLTMICFVVSYFTITAMIGWPTFTSLPTRFNLVATRVVPPDIATGTGGHVYLWAEELNENNVPIGAPRAYEVPFSQRLASDAQSAQSKINSGKQVMGESGGRRAKADETGKAGKAGDQAGQRNGNNSNGGLPGGQTTAADSIGEGAQVIFADMPPVILPDKANMAEPAADQQ